MSLSGATRALGSSIIKGSFSKLDGLRPAAVTCLPAHGRRAKATLRLPRVANAHCWGRERRRRGRSYRLADGLQAVENRAVGTLNAGLCATASPSVGPREANFFPYLSIQLPPVGYHLLGLGITRFRLAWKVRALTRLSPWGGLRARRFQRDISAQSDRQGGLSLGGTAGHRGATSARPRGIAPDSHTTVTVAAGARKDAAPTDDRADVAPASDRSRAAPIGNRIGRDTFPRHVWAQDRWWRLGRGHGGFGHHELPRPRTGRDRSRARY